MGLKRDGDPANRAAVQLFTGKAEGFVKKDFRDIMGPHNSHIIQYVDHVYRARRSIVGYAVDLRVFPGKEHSGNLNVDPLIGHKDEYQGVVLFFET